MNEDLDVIDPPCSLAGILQPDEALAAAQRLQRRYQSNAPGANSLFGRDGRRVEGRLPIEIAGDPVEA